MSSEEDFKRVAEAARDYWWPERLAGDFGERQLHAALIRAFGAETSETCGCEEAEECDECPSQASIDAFLAKADAELAAQEKATADYIAGLPASFEGATT